MCGIAGAVAALPETEISDRIWRIVQELSHRGPDGSGVFAKDGVAIGNSRLAVIDLEQGDQPKVADDGKVAAVLNGEIYNFKKIRGELESLGHKFTSNSDTECILRGYLEWGTSLPDHLDGMFAIAIIDRRNDSVFLARDRFGEKPLFYANGSYGTVFASEIKALLNWPNIPRTLNRESLGYFIRLGFVPGSQTLFKEIQQLEPGTAAVITNSVIRTWAYFRPQYRPDNSIKTLDDAADILRPALESTVISRTVSDVPLAVLLSGGIDSSAVAAIVAANSNRPIQTFTVRFEEQSYDESPIAREVAEHIGSEHHEITVPNAGFTEEHLSRIVDHVGQPFHDSSAIPTYLVSREVQKHVKVCLTGDGGDEMFAGYPTYDWATTVRRLGRIPSSLLKAATPAIALAGQIAPARFGEPIRQAGRAFAAASQPNQDQISEIMSLFLQSEVGSLITDSPTKLSAQSPLSALTELPDEANEWSGLRQTMYTMLTKSLPADMLVKTDRMSMAASLELRSPFLGNGIADVSFKMPEKFLRANKTGKLVLRQAVKDMLPESVFSHPKSGFSIPLHSFQNAEYEAASQRLLQPSSTIYELLDESTVTSIKQRALSNSSGSAVISKYRASHQLWSLMQLATWLERFNVTL
jgi:asparagine synthase (glutamine-hydrolysing)